jgi:hypothetical protein
LGRTCARDCAGTWSDVKQFDGIHRQFDGIHRRRRQCRYPKLYFKTSNVEAAWSTASRRYAKT